MNNFPVSVYDVTFLDFPLSLFSALSFAMPVFPVPFTLISFHFPAPCTMLSSFSLKFSSPYVSDHVQTKLKSTHSLLTITLNSKLNLIYKY